MRESTRNATPRDKNYWPLLVFILLACLLLWPVVFGGQVFVPATLLRYVAPWEQDSKPPWNPLMYDSVGQFYPWRHFAAEELRAGRIPLWNPYQFCGTPFVANSQSAVFYPGNLLYWLLPTARAAGFNVILHLCLAGWFTYAFLRANRLSAASATFGGVAFAFSGWQVSWLALPTFLCTSCWLPLVLLCVKNLAEIPTWRRALALGFVLGMTLLAGHIQVAFYVALSAILYAIWLVVTRTADRTKDEPSRPRIVARSVGLFGVALCAGGMLASPQLLPTFELSRRSHRTGPVSAQSYQSYVSYAVHPASLVTLFVPNYYGNPSDPSNPYAGASRGGQYFNYAEGAMYVGIPTLLLAAFSLFRGRQIGWRAVGFFGLLALLSLSMATGTFVDALLYFYLPGFGQSGSPGRSLVLWAFAIACLAAFGYEKLNHDNATPVKSVTTAIAAVTLLGGILLLAGPAAALGKDFSIARVMPDVSRQAGILLAGGVVIGLATGKLRRTRYCILPVVMVSADLLATGSGYNLTAAEKDVYPSRTSLTALRQAAGHDRIMPINRGWSFAGPHALLPPNGAMVFGLRDVQGYDSLFPGQYKAFMNELSGTDASPQEVGNMVFAKNPISSLAAQAGIRYLLSRQELPFPDGIPTVDGFWQYPLPYSTGRAYVSLDGGTNGAAIWKADDPTRLLLLTSALGPGTLVLADQFYPGWKTTVDGSAVPMGRIHSVFRSVRLQAGSHAVEFKYDPAAFRVGLYLACLVVGAVAATEATRIRSHI